MKQRHREKVDAPLPRSDGSVMELRYPRYAPYFAAATVTFGILALATIPLGFWDLPPVARNDSGRFGGDNAAVPSGFRDLPPVPRHVDHRGLPSVARKVDARKKSAHEAAREAVRAAQIENYRGDAALMVHIHVTHHGGTTFCRTVGHALGDNRNTPGSACTYTERGRRIDPWSTRRETKSNVRRLRKKFHMISWEYQDYPVRNVPLASTDWESPQIVSIVIMRDPMARMLTDSSYLRQTFGHGNEKIESLTARDWHEYSRSAQTDNFALRILTGRWGCCSGADTDPEHLRMAQELLRRMTYVLDMACLDEGMARLSAELGITRNIQKDRRVRSHVGSSPEERIKDKEIYRYLVEKNRLDRKLYEWSKSLALVDCASV